MNRPDLLRTRSLRGSTLVLLGCLLIAAGTAAAAARPASKAKTPKAVASKAAPAVSTAAPAPEPLQPGERRLEYGAPFGTVTLYTPAGAPRSVVIFLSGDGGWHLGVIAMARHLRDQGAAVVGIDVRRYLADIAAGKGGNCRYMAADFETLAHRIEREFGMSEYRQPLLYGYSSGATVVYAVLVQSPPGTFGAAVSLGFCADQKFGGAALCPGPGVKLTYHPGEKGAWVFDPAARLSDRWVAFQGEIDTVCSPGEVDRFVAGVGNAELIRLPHVGHGFGVEPHWLPQFQQLFDRLVRAQQPAPVAADVSDLPLIELPAAHPSDAPLALLLTGDGGWAGIDRGVAQAFQAHDVPVVALSSLKYFWRARSIDQSALDVARILRHYLAAWHRERVMLVGYSFGADVLPFIVNRLPDDLRARVQSVDLLGLSENASFEIRVSGWVPGSEAAGAGTFPVQPEIRKMQSVRALCLYGAGEKNDPCARFAGGVLQSRQIGEGHHFGGEYEDLARAMLDHAGVTAAGTANAAGDSGAGTDAR